MEVCMGKKNVSAKSLLRKQTALCFLLMAVLVVLSLGSLYTVKVEPAAGALKVIEKIETAVNEFSISETAGGGTPLEFKLADSVSVNVWMLTGILLELDDAINIYNGIMDVVSAVRSGDGMLQQESLQSLGEVMSATKEFVTGDAFVNLISLIVAVYSAFCQSIVAGVIMVIMLVMTLALPIILAVHILITAIGWLFRVGNAEKSHLWINKCFKRTAAIFSMVLALLLFDNKIGLGWGMLVSFAICALGFLLSLWFSLDMSRTAEGKRYINVLLSCSGVKIVGFAMFFVCLARTEIFGQYIAIIVKDFSKNISSKEYGTVFLKQYISVMLAAVAVVAIVASMLTLVGALARIGGMVHRNKELCLFTTVMALILPAIPLIVALYDDRIVLQGEGTVLLILGAFVGALIMLGSEIALPICRKKLCVGLKESEKDAVLRGIETIETELYVPEEEEITA